MSANKSRTDDLCICALSPKPFYGVRMWYRNFDQITDQEVIDLLEMAKNTKTEAIPLGRSNL